MRHGQLWEVLLPPRCKVIGAAGFCPTVFALFLVCIIHTLPTRSRSATLAPLTQAGELDDKFSVFKSNKAALRVPQDCSNAWPYPRFAGQKVQPWSRWRTSRNSSPLCESCRSVLEATKSDCSSEKIYNGFSTENVCCIKQNVYSKRDKARNFIGEGAVM